MRKILALQPSCAVGAASRVAEARDRTFSFRHFSPHAGTGFHLPHHGPKFHYRGFFGKHRHFKPWPFGHFGQRPGTPSSGALALDQHPRPGADRQWIRLHVQHHPAGELLIHRLPGIARQADGGGGPIQPSAPWGRSAALFATAG
jgi:hypothetical protein